jgi:ribosomal-protein-alanine N-acetyltransferase
MYYLQDIQTHSFEESKSNLEFAIEQINIPARENYFFRIEELDGKEHVGEIGYTVTDFTPMGKLVHLGYFIYKKFWGIGYVTEAVREIMRFAFEENDVYRITSGCILDNIGSERVMQKCGMSHEAMFIKKVWHDDRMKNRVEYRMLKEEWECKQKGDCKL